MAPLTTTDDYYSRLEVDQSATPELVTRSYRRLALKLHPDRGGSTQAFQLLGIAYETLNDENKRRAYDQIYSSIGRNRTNPQSSQNKQTSRPPPTAASRSQTVIDEDQLAALRKENEVRGAQWRVKQEGLMSPIIALQRSIRVLEQEIKELGDAAVAEAAVEARKKNPTASDLLSALSIEDDEGEKARKDRRRRRRERKTEIESKEWQIGLQEAELQGKQKVLNQAKESNDAANLISDRKIQAIEARMHAKKAQEQRRREMEGRERERFQKLTRQAKEASEAAKKRQAEMQKSREAMRDQRAETRKVREEAQKAREASSEQPAEVQKARYDAKRTRDHAQRAIEDDQRVRCEAQKARDDAQRVRDEARRVRVAAQRVRDDAQRARRKAREVLAAELARKREQQELQSACGHGDWWDKVPGPTTCPGCQGVWSFLLKCPGCNMQACPRCQLGLRQRIRRNAAKTDESSD